MKNHILIIDDDTELCRLVKKYLENENYKVAMKHSGQDGMSEALNQEYLLIILDVMLPEINGFDVLSELRKHSAVPVLMLTAKDSEVDKISGLRLGADDYLTKPFSMNELVARVQSLIRRYTTLNGQRESVQCNLEMGALSINQQTREVFVSGNSVELTAKEFDLLKIARDKAYSLESFVNTLFEWSKLESKEITFNFETIDINECTRNIIIGWLPTLEQRNIGFDIDISEQELFIKLDKGAYTRIINNLIQNAVSHSGGTHIQIEVKPCEHGVSIKVADNGKGIPENQLPFIFERLYKCDAARAHQGSGLGLAITKELVTAHNGKIMAVSIPNEKTTFTVLLPN